MRSWTIVRLATVTAIALFLASCTSNQVNNPAYQYKRTGNYTGNVLENDFYRSP